MGDSGGGRDPGGRERDPTSTMPDSFEALFEHALDAILIADDDGRYVDVNPSACRLLGYRRDELVGRSIGVVIADGQDWRQAWRRFLRAGSFRGEITLRHRDGTEIPAEHHAVAHILPGRHASFSRDLRSRRRVEEALTSSEERFRRAFDESPVGLLLTSSGLAVRRANRSFAQLAGRPSAMLVGRHVAEVFRDGTVARELSSGLPRRRGTMGPLEGRLQRPDGQVSVGRVSAVRVHDADGGEAEILISFEDVTPLVAAAAEHQCLLAEVRALGLQLAEVEQSERRALARQLHESLGHNLGALSMDLALARRDLDVPARRGQVEEVLTRSLATVQEVGARIYDVMAELRPPMLDDYGVVATLRWLGDRLAQRTGLTVRVRGHEPEPRLGEPAEGTLVLVAQEALSNVGRHAAASRVTVTLHSTPGLVRLTVTDDGVGFEPDGVPSASDGGGWGLVGMRERVQAVAGRLRINAAPGRGVRVVAELPR